MQIDPGLRDEIDRSIGAGPAGVPLDELLVRGHRAVVRRRALAGMGATFAAVTILGTTAALTGGAGAQSSAPPGYAGQPGTSTPVPTREAPPVLRTPSPREAQRAFARPLAELDDSGSLVLARKVRVVRRVDDPFASGGPETSVALELEHRRVRYWFVLHQEPDKTEWSAYVWPGDYEGTFDGWVAEQAPDRGGDSSAGDVDAWPGIPDLDLVTFAGSSGSLAPTTGVTILRQQTPVSVGEAFAGPGDETAAAKVETAEGERYYVLARRAAGGPAQYIAVAEADGGPTLESFLDLARSRYAEKGGGLL